MSTDAGAADVPARAPAAGRVDKTYARMRRVADGPAAVVILYIWAFAEAWMWPLIPDSALMGMTFAAPRRTLRLWCATVAGTLSGGLAGLAAARASLRWPLPLVTDRMREAADGWLAEGAAGLWHQPLSGVPYKTFVQAAGALDIDTGAWLAYTAAARGGRMLLLALFAAGAGRLLVRLAPAHLRARVHVSVVAVCTVVLFAGLAAMVHHWS